MSDMMLFSISLSISFLVICITLCVVVRGIWNASSANVRAGDRERGDFIRLVERLIERKDTPVQRTIDLAALHGHERMAEIHAERDVEKEAIKRDGKKPLVEKKDRTATVDVSLQDPAVEANAMFQ